MPLCSEDELSFGVSLGFSTLPMKRNSEGSKVISAPSTVSNSTLTARGKRHADLELRLLMSSTANICLALRSLCSYSSGGEDGYVRIHHFDPQYFDFELEA